MYPKILIVGPAWIGDTVMAQVLFKVIKQRMPKAVIHVLVPKSTAALIERMPEVDGVVILPFKHGELSLRRRYHMGKDLRKSGYTQTIILPNSFKSALVPFFAKIPKRTGWRGEIRYGLLNDVRILAKDKLPLMIQRFAALGLDGNVSLPKDLPWPELKVRQDLSPYLRQKFKIDDHKPILALCPGAEYGLAKRWPASYFAEVANAKVQDGWQVLLFGGTNDQSVADEIQDITKESCLNLIGKTSLLEVIDLLAMVTAVVTNDTGLMHIAAALNKPIVAIYGSSSPKFTPPLTEKVEVVSLELPCSPCFKRECQFKHLRCLRDLKPKQVLAALTKVLV